MSTMIHAAPAAEAGSTVRRAAATLRARLARAIAALRRRAQEARTREALSRLDDATLRDLGLHRSEIGSLAAEAHGRAEAARWLSRQPLLDWGRS